MSNFNPRTADWPLTSVRYYFLDYDGGLDSNLGYLDAAAGNVFTAPQLVGIPLKTFTRLLQVIPTNGDGRSAVVLIKNRAAGAAYLKPDAVTTDVVEWTGIRGYKILIRRGSSDLTNSVNDKTQVGFVTKIAGPNGDGSWTLAAGSTTTSLVTAAGALPAEPGAIGYRIRFTGNVTPALANVISNISANTATVITLGVAIAAAAAGNTFFIEGPGILVGGYIDRATGPSLSFQGLNSFQSVVCDVGIVVNSALGGCLSFESGSRIIAGLETTSSVDAAQLGVSNSHVVALADRYVDETLAVRNIGMGARIAGGFSFWDIFNLNVSCFAHVKVGGAAYERFTNILFSSGITEFVSTFSGGILTNGSYVASRLVFGQGVGIPGLKPLLTIGGARTRVVNNGLRFRGSSVLVDSIDFANCTNSCIAFDSSPVAGVGCTVMVNACTGTSGNTSTGINFSQPEDSSIIITGCTVAGTGGEIQAASCLIKYADLAITNIIDVNFTKFRGLGARILNDIAYTLTNASGGALTVGQIVRLTGGVNVTKVQADTAANATGALFVALTSPANGVGGYFVPLNVPIKWIQFDGVPTINSMAYLSPGTAGNATITIPAVAATNQKRRIGFVSRVSGTLGLVVGTPENMPVLADGLL